MQSTLLYWFFNFFISGKKQHKNVYFVKIKEGELSMSLGEKIKQDEEILALKGQFPLGSFFYILFNLIKKVNN